MDIVAEIVNDRPDLRAWIKTTKSQRVIMTTKPTKTFDPNGVYAIYAEYHKPLQQIPSHAYLALARAEKEKQLSLSCTFPYEDIIAYADRLIVPTGHDSSVIFLRQAMEDGITRLLLPSLTNELRSDHKHEADRQAIDVFGTNVQELLLSSPVR